MAGVLSESLTSTNITLSASDTQNCMLRLTGALLADIVLSPDTAVLMNGFYYWENLTTGAHSVTLTLSSGSLVLPQSRRGVLFADTVNGPRMVSIVGSASPQVFPAGTVSPFYQNAAPTGWTINASLNDYGMRIVSSAGGVTSGGASPYSTANTADYTLQIADMPSHNHAATGGTVGGTSTFAAGTGGFTAPLGGSTIVIGNTGGGGAHHHGATSNIRTADFIIATLN